MYFAGFAPVSVLVVRTAVDPSSLVRAIRNVVFEVDPTQPVFEVRTGVELLDASMARQRFSSMLFSVFSLLALMLAAGGVYGVTAYAVAERTREIGLRMALGAQPGDVLRLVLRQEMLAAMIGLVVGIGGGFAVTKLLTALLYGVSPSDPTAYLGASVLLAGTIALASYIPARRATRVDPMVALRYE
jgi:putative ABC transport system permease protein